MLRFLSQSSSNASLLENPIQFLHHLPPKNNNDGLRLVDGSQKIGSSSTSSDAGGGGSSAPPPGDDDDVFPHTTDPVGSRFRPGRRVRPTPPLGRLLRPLRSSSPAIIIRRGGRLIRLSSRPHTPPSSPRLVPRRLVRPRLVRDVDDDDDDDDGGGGGGARRGTPARRHGPHEGRRPPRHRRVHPPPPRGGTLRLPPAGVRRLSSSLRPQGPPRPSVPARRARHIPPRRSPRGRPRAAPVHLPAPPSLSRDTRAHAVQQVRRVAVGVQRRPAPRGAEVGHRAPHVPPGVRRRDAGLPGQIRQRGHLPQVRRRGEGRPRPDGVARPAALVRPEADRHDGLLVRRARPERTRDVEAEGAGVHVRRLRGVQQRVSQRHTQGGGVRDEAGDVGAQARAAGGEKEGGRGDGEGADREGHIRVVPRPAVEEGQFAPDPRAGLRVVSVRRVAGGDVLGVLPQARDEQRGVLRHVPRRPDGDRGELAGSVRPQLPHEFRRARSEAREQGHVAYGTVDSR